MWGGPEGCAWCRVRVPHVCPPAAVSSHHPCLSHLSVRPSVPLLSTDSVSLHPPFAVPTASWMSPSIPLSVCPLPSPSAPIAVCPLLPMAVRCFVAIPFCLSILSSNPCLSVHPPCPSIPMSILAHPSVRSSIPFLSIPICLSVPRWPSVSPLPAGFPVGRGPLRGSAPAVGIPPLLHSGPWPHRSASAAAAERPSPELSVGPSACMGL